MIVPSEDIVIQDETGKLKPKELSSYLFEVDADYEPPISKSVDLNKYANKLINRANIITVRDQGKLAGVCAFYCNESNEKAYISTIGVLSLYERKGIANKILTKLISIIKQRNIQEVLLEVNNDNNKALRFYEKHGFKTTDMYSKKDLNGVDSKWKLMTKYF